MININQNKNVREKMRFLISFGMTKRGSHYEATKLPWQSHYDYNRKAVIANEVSVAISLSLFTIRNVVIASLQNAGVAISLLTIRKSKLQNVKIKMQNEDNLIQIDSE